MGKKQLWWRKAVTVAAAVSLVLQSCLPLPGMAVLAEEGSGLQQETELPDLLELTAQELETEESSAVSARLKIGDWLDYGDYGIEREDIPGTDYLFYITTQDAKEQLIDDEQLAYCLQSYFLTPMPGDHSQDMTDNVSAIGGSRDVQKVLYYGYGGAGYDADEFVNYLVRADGPYYENVYMSLSEEEQSELAYILTHGAASYAYFVDGTSFEEYLALQFELKYGEDWEKQLEYFEEQEMERSGIEDGDLDLLAATYGMNETGIALSRGWYQLLTEKKDPELSVTSEDGRCSFNGNERNEELTLSFDVPEGSECTVFRENGTIETAAAGKKVTVSPAESFSFTFTGESFSSATESAPETVVPVSGELAGAEREVWNLVLLETSKGTRDTISKRQQDIAAVSMTDAGRTELEFEVEMQLGSVGLSLTDEAGQAVPGAVFEVFYDEECSVPARQDGEAVTVTTDENGEAGLRFVMNQKLLENGGRLYVRQQTAPAGYIPDETVHCIETGASVELTNGRETVAVRGTVKWKVPEGTKLPEEVFVVLEQDGETIDRQTVTAEDDWGYVWDGLQKYGTGEDGDAAEYVYRVDEEPVEGYSTAVEGSDVVNTITGETVKAGQVIWHDSEDADGLRPESAEVNLYREGALIDSMTITGEDDWKYSFDGLDKYRDDGTQENVYSVSLTVPDGYTAVSEEDEIILTHPASVSPDIEIFIDLKGRDLKEGEFSFDLTQVTDETGEAEAVDGTYSTAVNDPEGKVAFEDIIITEPGTYYYRITGTPSGTREDAEEDVIVVKAEVTESGEYKDQLKAEVTYPEGQPVFSYTYTAGGEVVIDGIHAVLENGTLSAGMFRFELKDSEGTVLQTVTNDESGNAAFEPLKFTEENIGQKLEYTVSEVSDGADGITYDSAVYTVTIRIEDSETSDGTLRITKEAGDMVFTNLMAEPETETETEAVTEPESVTETEAVTEQESGMETEAETEPESVTETEVVTEQESGMETEAETEPESVTETETVTEPETEMQTENQEEQNGQKGIVLPLILFMLILVLLILIFAWKKIKNQK